MTNHQSTLLRVLGLTKAYDSVTAVSNLTFELPAGQVLGVVGPNGAGKTTTMRCICGIIPPSEGLIEIDGVRLAEAPIEAKRRLAFVPADPMLFDYLTVREHLAFYARVFEVGDRRAQGEELLAQLDLAEKADHLPAALSRGMKQKLMVACALIHDPKLLIFDEPFTGLDPYAIVKVKQLLRQRADAGASVMVSSHLLAMTEDLVDSLLILRRGVCAAYGSRAALSADLEKLSGKGDLEAIFMHYTADASASVDAGAKA